MINIKIIDRSHTVINFPPENNTEMCFPDENYDYDKLSENSIFVGAYDGNTCIGLAVLQHAMMKYIYLYDLKVNREYRGRTITLRHVCST